MDVRGQVKSRRVFWQVYCALATTHALLCGYEAYWNSPTRDELAHLAAGISHITFQRFDLFRVNPPLVRSVAAAASCFRFSEDRLDCLYLPGYRRAMIAWDGDLPK